MDIQLLAVRIVRRLRLVGVRATLREALARLRPVPDTGEFDRRCGTDTGGFVRLWKLRINSPNARFGGFYAAIDEQTLVDGIGALREDLRTLTFIDLGCGKGRPLLVAANLGFKHVIGVEFALELSEVARKNLEKMKVDNAVVVRTDAAEYRFPDGDMVVFLYNPFSEEVVQKVIANLRETLAKKLYVIYAKPECAALFDASGFLTRLTRLPGREDVQIWVRQR